MDHGKGRLAVAVKRRRRFRDGEHKLATGSRRFRGESFGTQKQEYPKRNRQDDKFALGDFFKDAKHRFPPAWDTCPEWK